MNPNIINADLKSLTSTDTSAVSEAMLQAESSVLTDQAPEAQLESPKLTAHELLVQRLSHSDLLQLLDLLTKKQDGVLEHAIIPEHIHLVERLLNQVTTFLSSHLDIIERLRSNQTISHSIAEYGATFIEYRQWALNTASTPVMLDDQNGIADKLSRIRHDYVVLRELLIGVTLFIQV